MAAEFQPLRSMTGFAQARRESGGAVVAVTLKTVNHRFFDLRWQAPPELEPALPELEKRLRETVRRGHVEARIAWERGGAGSGPALDPALAEAYLRAHAELSERLELRAPPTVGDLLRFPGMLAARGPAPGAGPDRGLLDEACAAALAALDAMRQAEGAALARGLAQCLDRIESLRREIAGLRPQVEAAQLERLRRRVGELLGAAAPSPERLLQEAALLAERSDIEEELTRIEAHLGQCRGLLAAGGEIGKRLDFLAQELNREGNTLLAKSTAATPPGLRLSALGLDLKAEIEKLREQVQNLE